MTGLSRRERQELWEELPTHAEDAMKVLADEKIQRDYGWAMSDERMALELYAREGGYSIEDVWQDWLDCSDADRTEYRNAAADVRLVLGLDEDWHRK